MSHEIEIKPDGQASAFFVGQPAWHGLGTVLSESPTIAEALKLSGLDWKVGLQPVLYQKPPVPSKLEVIGPNPPVLTEIPQYRATVRESDGTVLGIVGKQFVPLQNSDAFDWFEPFIASGAVKLDAAGSLRDGKRVWITASLVEREGGIQEIVPKDKVKLNLILAHAHDGGLAIRVGLTPIRVVCANTLKAAINDTKTSQLLKIRHTSTAPVALAVVREIIDTARKEFAATADVFRILAATGCDLTTLKRYVRMVFDPATVNDDDALPRLTKNIVELFEGGKGAELGRGTLWNAYNAITEYLTHFQGRTQDGRLDSQWFGKSALIIERALSVACAISGRKELASQFGK